MAHDKLLEVLKILRAEKARLEETIATFERLVEEGSRGRESRRQLVEASSRDADLIYRRDARHRKRKQG
jgi:hypothetical protein